MKASYQAAIDVPVDRIDLPEWMATLSDRDYQACSPAHIAAGVFYENDGFGTINVESIGGHLFVHHYMAEEASARRIVMHSRDTRAYLFHVAPVTVEIIWTMEVEPSNALSSLLRCTVEARMPMYLRVLSSLVFLPLFVRWHTEQETPSFAANIARKVLEGKI